MSKRNKRGPHNRELATAGPPKGGGNAPKGSSGGGKPPSKPSAPQLTTAQQDAAKTNFARYLAMGGFAVCFSLMGLLSGLNHWIDTPSSVTGPLALSVWLGAALGDLQLDWVRAMMTAGLGLIVGVTLGSTIGLRSPKMLAAWVFGSLAMTIGLMSTHNPAVGAVGWLLGITLAVRSPVA